MLQDHQLDKNVKKALAVTFCVNTTIDKAIDKSVNKTVDRNKENKEIINVEEFFDKFSETNNLFSTLLQQIILKPSGDGKDKIDKTGKLLEELFDRPYKNNKVVKKIIDAKACDLQKLPTALIKKSIVLSMRDLKIKNKQLYVKNRMYIPENTTLQLHLLQQHHNSLIHGHLGYKDMYWKIQERYF